MAWTWLVLSAVAAVVDWTATWFSKPRVMYAAKPATLIFLILATYASTRWQGEMLFFGIGLVFCLLGDILLMMRARFFILGLASFLVGQTWYMAALNQTPLPSSPLAYAGGLLLVLTAILPVGFIYKKIRSRNGPRHLAIAVIIYGLIEGLFLVSASLTLYKDTWLPLHARLITLGAALFVVSDVILGIDRFDRPIAHGRTMVHVTYHLGQIIIVAAAIQHALA
jgi:alkenylglycerophosphocholine/alkenylglycerophosphoethanolamine hydrolase